MIPGDPLSVTETDEDSTYARSTKYRPVGKSAATLQRMDQAVDLVLAHPDLPDADLAALVGWTRTRFSTVRNSDLFQSKLAERREELAPDLSVSINDRMRAVVVDGIEELHRRIPSMPNGDLLGTVTLASRNIGLGVQPRGPTVAVQINNDPRRLSDDELERLVAMQASQVTVDGSEA